MCWRHHCDFKLCPIQPKLSQDKNKKYEVLAVTCSLEELEAAAEACGLLVPIAKVFQQHAVPSFSYLPDLFSPVELTLGLFANSVLFHI